MLEAILFLLALGCISGTLLGIASRVFYVYEDPRIELVEDVLPGANCGGCGYAGCSAAAASIVSGDAPPNVCIVGGDAVARAIGDIMGVSVGAGEPRYAHNTCNGGDRAENRFHYLGVWDCRAAVLLYGGEKECDKGCLGMGTCVRTCLFGAITMGDNGVPVFNPDRCTGCGACAKACPKGVIKVLTPSEQILSFNMMDDRLAPCRQTCPAEIDIPTYIDHIKHRRYEEALLTIKERNPFPLTCGRVCPHPCEEMCRRALADDPVAINPLKRFVADYEMNSGRYFPVPVAPDTGYKVAVIGGGPCGLTCAYYLRRLGHSVTVFEMQEKLGGMLYYGIPEYRLPKKILDWEIQGILNLGIKAKTNVKFGVDFDLASLVGAGYDAIFLAVGAWKYSSARLEGEDRIRGVYGGTVFLERCGREIGHPIGRRVGVIGGGNTAMDAARTSLRLGAEKVYIIYRRTENEMPANAEEIQAAREEGIEFLFLAAPNRIIENDGVLTHLEYLKMRLGEPDESGRRRPIPIEGSETRIPLDNLILAIGQVPDLSFMDSSGRIKDLETTRWRTIVGDPDTNQTSIPYVFAGGDVYTGPWIAVGAIGNGRQAARSIHLYLTGEDMRFPDGRLKVDIGSRTGYIPGTIFDKISGVQRKGRIPKPELEPNERIHSMDEVELTISEEDALREAGRCMNCCLTCYDKDA